MLIIDKLTRSFGGLTAVSNVSMQINKGELVGIIGPNGAGKTTLFNLLTGVYEPSSGTIKLELNGEEVNIGGLKPYNVTKAGLARTFQNIRLFKDLTVLDNVRIAMHQNVQYKLPSSFFRFNNFYQEEDKLLEEAEQLLDIFKMSHKKNELAKNLPYGEQRHLEIVRALATKPAVLLLDEPAAGMNPFETEELTNTIKWIREEFDLTVLLIEHDMSLVMEICERIFVLDYGMLIASGTPAEIRTNKGLLKPIWGRMSVMLEIKNLNVHYGVIHALKNASLTVNKGEIVTLIGANGAGKTSTLRTISGLNNATSGEIFLEGQNITNLPAPDRVELGLSQVPEGRRVFPEMSVLENLELGAFLRKDKTNIKKDLEHIYELFPILGKRKHQSSGTLSGGEQQMLAMGRALMSQPKILLLDEPSMGLAPLLVREIFKIITDINNSGTTILLVEQNASMALSIAHRAYVIENGSIVMSGTGEELAKSSEIQKAYLGGK